MALGLSTALLAIGTRGRADEPEAPRTPSLLGQARATADGELIVGLSADKSGSGSPSESDRGMLALKALARNRLQVVVRFPGRKPVALFVEPLPDRRLRIRDERGESGNLECSMLTINLPVGDLPAPEDRPKEPAPTEKKTDQDKEAIEDQILEAKLDTELLYAEVQGLHQRVLNALQFLMSTEDRVAQSSAETEEGRKAEDQALESAKMRLERLRTSYLKKSREHRHALHHLTELQRRVAAPGDAPGQ
jgi:hypothetical protein